MTILHTAEPPRVLLLLDRLGVGGAAQVALNLALSLDREKFLPIVCITHNMPANGQDEMLRQAGVPVIEVKRKSVWQPWAWVPLWRVLPTISILHSHGCGANFWGRIWGRIFRVPAIVTQYHIAADQKGKVFHFFDRAMEPLSNRIITVSQFDRELSICLEKLPPDKVVTIYNGVDVAKFDIQLSKTEARQQAGLPRDKWLLAIVARLDPQKNHRDLLDALTLLPEDLKSKLGCLIVGSGPLESQLRRDVEKLGLQESVSLLGERNDVPTILRAIDVLVLSSWSECLPVVILEALAARCSVVATAVGGVPEVLSGLGWPLVSPGDPKGLAEAIVSIFHMPEAKRNGIAETGRQMVMDKFNREVSVAEVEKLYQLLLSSSYR
jgi:glycosyltransferase involved in cell wall biosynthesis